MSRFKFKCKFSGKNGVMCRNDAIKFLRDAKTWPGEVYFFAMCDRCIRRRARLNMMPDQIIDFEECLVEQILIS